MSINEYGGIFTDAIGRKGKNTSVEVFLPNYLDWRFYYLDDPPPCLPGLNPVYASDCNIRNIMHLR